jgi:hypothetical protein
MSERIRELAAQAMVERASGFREFDADLFAELIVRECAKRSEELGQPELGKGLMKHFGVES